MINPRDMKRIMIFLAAIVFLSLAMQGGVVKLAILSDVHVTPGNANEDKLRQAVAEINATDVDAECLLATLLMRAATTSCRT